VLTKLVTTQRCDNLGIILYLNASTRVAAEVTLISGDVLPEMGAALHSMTMWAVDEVANVTDETPAVTGVCGSKREPRVIPRIYDVNWVVPSELQELLARNQAMLHFERSSPQADTDTASHRVTLSGGRRWDLGSARSHEDRRHHCFMLVLP